MTILITGGAGFIGSNFIFYTMREHPEDRIVCLDKLTYAGSLSTLEPVLKVPNFRFVQADICDETRIFELFAEEKPDCVVNFAAESHVDRSIASSVPFAMSNFVGVSVLLEACRAFSNVRFHQVSTDEVCGDLPLDRPDLRFTESSRIDTNGLYSATKGGAELLVTAFFRTHRLPVTISRCGNNYGPWQYPEKLIPFMIANALHGRNLPVYGTGENVRDWIHVSDHCRAIDAILRNGVPGEIYNVGAECEQSNLSVVRRLCGLLDISESRISFVPDRKGHDRRYAVDSSKLRRELGWQPKTDFENGLRETVSWYLENRSWWEPLFDSER